VMAEIVKMGTRFSRFAKYVPETIRTYLPVWLAQNQAAMAIDPYLRGEHPLPVSSNTPSTQQREILRKMATTPYGRLILNSTTQALNVRGVRSPGEEEIPGVWRDFWLKNKMVARQNAIFRSAVGYGQGYTSVLPGQLGISAEDGLVIRNYTPKTMTAFFDEPWDEYPAVALNGEAQIDERGQQYWIFQLFDDEAVHFAYVYELQLGAPHNVKIEYLESRTHEADVTPVVHHSPLVDDDGGSRGEVLPFLPFISRLDPSVSDRPLIPRQAAGRVRTASGVEGPEGKAARDRMAATTKADATPVVLRSPLVDDDGGSRGEVLPFLPIISRLDQSVYDRLLIQRQAAWRVRTASGVKKPEGKAARDRMEATMKAGDLLTSDK